MSKAINGFVMLPRTVLCSPEWHALSPGARCLLLDIWSYYNGRNNGSIAYSQRQCETVFRCSPKTAVKWFAELQDGGFLVATRRGDFRLKAGERERRASLWSIPVAPKPGTGGGK